MSKEMREQINKVKNWKQFLNEDVNNVYTLYHGTNTELIDINQKYIWLTPNIEYAKIWGDNIYKVEITIYKLLDTYTDLGNKKMSLKYIFKYLESKGVDVSDFKYVTRNYDSDEKYIFWELIRDHKPITYGWLSTDIFSSGYDAISCFEYGFSKKQKGESMLINSPKSKIININKIS